MFLWSFSTCLSGTCSDTNSCVKLQKKVLWSGSLNTMAKAVIRKTLIQICRPPELMTMKAISYTISYAISYTISHCISHTISYKYTMSYTKMRYRIRYNNVYDIVYDIVYVLTDKFIPPALPMPPIFCA